MFEQWHQRHDRIEFDTGVTVAGDRQQHGHDLVARVGHSARGGRIGSGDLRATRQKRHALAQHDGIGLETIYEIIAGGRCHQLRSLRVMPSSSRASTALKYAGSPVTSRSTYGASQSGSAGRSSSPDSSTSATTRSRSRKTSISHA